MLGIRGSSGKNIKKGFGMILCLDVGNTSIHGGVFKEDNLILQFRKTATFRGSSDETGIFFAIRIKGK